MPVTPHATNPAASPPLGVRQNLPARPQPRRSRARRYHPRLRRAAGSLLAYITGLILARAEVSPGYASRTSARRFAITASCPNHRQPSITLKTAVHPREPRPALMFTPPRAVLRDHPLDEVRSSCAAQWNWAFRAAPAFPTAGFRITHPRHSPRTRRSVSSISSSPCAALKYHRPSGNASTPVSNKAIKNPA